MNKLLLLLAFYLPLFYSCGTKKQAVKEQKTVFNYNESAGITSLDPAFARNVENIWAVNQLFNGLVQMNDKLQVEPCIAKSWEISKDGLKYTFYIKTDVYFHNHMLFYQGKGRKVVASDFVHSFFRIIDPEVASPGAWLFEHLDKSNDLGVAAINDSTLQLHLKNPFPPFLGLLTMQYCSVIPHEIVEHYGRDFRNNPIGTGPFKFKLWKEGVKLIFSKNEKYFEVGDDGKPLPYLDAVSISFLNEKQVVFLEFVKGDLDFISGLDDIPKDEVLSQTGKLNTKYQNRFQIDLLPYLKTDYLGILVNENSDIVQSSPLRDMLVRKAVNYGIDREKMIKYLRNNIGIPATNGIIPYGMPSYDNNNQTGYKYDPKKAIQLLDDAGYTPSNKPSIIINTSSDYVDMCEYIQKQLTEIGFEVEIDVKPAVTLRQLVAKAKLNVFRKNWIADYPDAESYLALFYSDNFTPKGPNYCQFSNEEFDWLYEKSQLETNDSIRYQYYREMDSIIISEAPIVPLYYDQVIRLVQNNITGLNRNPMNLLTLKKVKKENY